MNRISDYALIGNGSSAALVGRDGAIDWCCLPHFDSGAVFCRLLDHARGGTFAVSPESSFDSRRWYDDGALHTEFESPSGRVRLTDFMPGADLGESRIGHDHAHRHRVLRRIQGMAGEQAIRVVFRPTFDFARAPCHITLSADGVRAASPRERLTLRASAALRFELADGAAQARLTVRDGECLWLELAYAAADAGDDEPGPADPQRMLEQTQRAWQEWQAHTRYEGPYADFVHQSARVLKLLTFAPTGAMVAAPTSSLPEALGGPRNWDYRYCWLRDAALVLTALMSLGHRRAAIDFFVWLEELCEGQCEHLHVMYRLDGGPVPQEIELPHLAGYAGSRPVRVGNAAADDVQLDVYGYVLDAAWYFHERMGETLRPGAARTLRFLADQAASRWHEPDRGIWEVRGPPEHFVSSKLLCWVALDRALRLHRDGVLDGDAQRWRAEREAIRHAVETQGIDPHRGSFRRAFGASGVDASLLLVPLVGFLPADDPRMRATVQAVHEELTCNGLVYRYRDADGVAGGEATFTLCTFWLVDNLALQGRLDEAHALFQHVLGHASDLGLFSEQIDPANGALLGNYPQGFTHLGLIKSALTLAGAEPTGRRRGDAPYTTGSH